MSIEGIILERFSALPPKEIKSPTKACTHHAVINDLFSDDNKQYSANTTAHIKRLIEMLEKKVLKSTLGTIWKNTDGCAEQYRCASALYLM